MGIVRVQWRVGRIGVCFAQSTESQHLYRSSVMGSSLTHETEILSSVLHTFGSGNALEGST